MTLPSEVEQLEHIKTQRLIVIALDDVDGATNINFELVGVDMMAAPTILRMTAVNIERKLGIKD